MLGQLPNLNLWAHVCVLVRGRDACNYAGMSARVSVCGIVRGGIWVGGPPADGKKIGCWEGERLSVGGPQGRLMNWQV